MARRTTLEGIDVSLYQGSIDWPTTPGWGLTLSTQPAIPARLAPLEYA